MVEPLAALSAAGVVLQFVQFGVELFAASKEIYESSASTLVGVADAQLIAQKWIKKLENVQAVLASQTCVDQEYEHLCRCCWKVALDLSQILGRLKAQGKRKMWASFKAALLTVAKKEEMTRLSKRFEVLRNEISNYMTCQKLEGICNELAELKQSSQLEMSSLSDLNLQLQGFEKRVTQTLERIPKELGNTWETGTPRNHIWIDDGIREPFSVPEFLCSSYQQFVNFIHFMWLEHTKELPGSYQIKKHHFELLDWNESDILDQSNWELLVKPGQGIKLSFIMGTWHGLPKTRCPRCGKPGVTNKSSLNYRNCGSCKLAIRQVDPTTYKYEPEDISFDFGRYWEFRTQEKSISSNSSSQTQETPSNGTTAEPLAQHKNVTPVDLKCRRLTIKWEPIFNVVCRYSLCRCIIWRATPHSFYSKEMLILLTYPCPRHNNFGLDFPDYGNIDYRDDPHFEQFGGYDMFRFGVHTFWPRLFEALGGEMFLSDEELQSISIHNDIHNSPEGRHTNSPVENMETEERQILVDIFNDYLTDHYEALMRVGVEVPEHVVEKVEERKRKQREISGLGSDLDMRPVRWDAIKIANGLSPKDFPHVKGVAEIFDGSFSGRPHWAIED